MRPGAEAHADSGTMTGKLTAEDPTHLLRTYPHRASGKREPVVWQELRGSPRGVWGVREGLREVKPGSGGGGEGEGSSPRKRSVLVKDLVPGSEGSGPSGGVGTGGPWWFRTSWMVGRIGRKHKHAGVGGWADAQKWSGPAHRPPRRAVQSDPSCRPAR